MANNGPTFVTPLRRLRPMDLEQPESQGQQRQAQPAQQRDEGTGGFWENTARAALGGLESAAGSVVKYLPETTQAVQSGALDLIGRVAFGLPANVSQPTGEVLAAKMAPSREDIQQYRKEVAPVSDPLLREGARQTKLAGPGTFRAPSQQEDFSLGETLGFGAEQAARSSGSMVLGAAAGLLTRSPRVASAIINAGTYGQELSGIIEDQKSQGFEDPNKAARMALAATALEAPFGTEAKAVAVTAKEVGKSLFRKGIIGTGKDLLKMGFTEGLTEIGQTGFERYGANRDIMSKDAIRDYIDAFAGGFGGGATMGAGFKALDKVAGPKVKEKEDREDDDLDLDLIQGQEDTNAGSDVAGGIESGDTITDGTKAAPKDEPEVLPTDIVKGLFNEANVMSALGGTGIAPKYAPTLAKRLATAFQNNNEKELDNILRAQEARLDPAHSSVKSEEDLTRNQTVHDTVAQLIGNFREFHSEALSQEELLTSAPQLYRDVAEANKQEVQRVREAQLRTEQANEILTAQQQEAALLQQQQAAAEAAAREAELAEAAKRVENIHRQGILQTVVSDPETRDPMKRFTALLKRNNFDPNITEEEAKALEGAIAKLEQKTASEAAKSGLSVQEYKDNLPAKSLKEAENLGMTPEQYMTAKGAADEMGISVPAFIQMRQEQQMAPAPAPTKAPPPYFELTAEREPGAADIAAMEKAQAKRDRKAQRQAAKMAEQAEDNRDQLSFLAEGAPVAEVKEGKEVITPAKTGIKQRYDVGKKAAAAFEAKEKAAREKAEAEAKAEAAKPKKAPAKKTPAKRPELPKDKKEEAPQPAPKEKKRAVKERKKPKSGVSERVGTGEKRETPEAGRGNRPVESREEPKETKQEVTEPELTYDEVLKEADSYLAEDGESGLLQPREYQQLSLLAEQGKMKPQELKDRLDAIVTARSEKAVSKAVEGKASQPTARRKGIVETLTGWAAKRAAKKQLDIARKTGSARALLKELATHRGDVGSIARTLLSVTKDDVPVKVISRKEMDDRYPPDPVTGAKTDGLFYPGEDAIYLPEDMLDYTTAIHEFGHALMVYELDADTALATELHEIFDRYATAARAQGITGSKVYGFKDVDEFLSEIFANSKFRAQLADILDVRDGVKTEKTLWDRVKAVFTKAYAKLVGRTYSGASKASRQQVEADIMRVFEIAAQVGRDRKGSYRGQEIGPKASQKKTVASKNMPEEFSEPADNVGKRFLRAADEALSVYGFTENLIEDAQKLIPSVKKYLTSMRDRMMKKEEMTRHIDGIRSKFVSLGLQRQGVGKGTINHFLQRSVNSEQWGFQPDWISEKVEINPKLEEEFKRLPAKEQEIVKETLKTSYDTLKTKIDAVIDAVNNNYETLILKAMDENNEKKVAKLELEQKNALAEYRGLFAARKDKPYVTTRRFGDYMVVAKSADMHSAVDLGDKKLIEEMKGQEDHYFVQRYDTLQEAREARAKLIKSGAFKGGTVVAGEIDKTYQQFVGNRDMMLAYDRLRKLIQNQVEALDENNKVNAKVIANMERMAVDLQLLALRQTSARKSELRKLGVAGGDMDMMRNFVAQGAADAHMISSLLYSKKIDEAIDDMRKEAFSDFSEDPERARRFYNELMLRHASGMAYEHSNMAETIKSVTSMMMLSLSPSYYLTNMTQPWVLSVPYMAGEHSYAKVNAEMLKSYSEVAKAWGDLNVIQPLDLSLVSDDVRSAVEELANRGRIDIGVDKEIGEFHSLKAGKVSNAFDKAGTIIRALSQKVESINRVSTAAAAYRLARDAGKSHEQAVDYADKVIRVTHGTYDGFNAPRWMRGPVLSTITQFKKFQLMQVTLLWKLFQNSLSKADTKDAKIERAVARRQLAFTMWHTMVLAGLRGMPGMTAAVFLWNLIVGAMDDDDEPEDIEKEIRDAIGKGYAELILTGAPSLAGIDISDRVGMGQVASIIPYTDIKFNRDGFYSALAGLLGPGAALVGKAGDAANALYKYGDYYGALGKLLPNGLDDAYAAVREATGGVKRGGDTVIDPEDISYGQTFARAMGVMTTERAKRLREQDRQYSVKEALKNRSSQITRAFIEAKDSGDTAALNEAREDWRKLQEERVRLGEKKQPLSNLLKAYRTRNKRRKSTVDGVEYTPKSAALRAAQEEAAEEE